MSNLVMACDEELDRPAAVAHLRSIKSEAACAVRQAGLKSYACRTANPPLTSSVRRSSAFFRRAMASHS